MTYAKSRSVVHATRRWFAQAPAAEQLAALAPGAMLGRNLAKSPQSAAGNESSRRLNALADCLPSRSTYLEIGVASGMTLEAVDVPFKWGVDPAPKFNTHALPQGYRFTVRTSNEFFADLDPHMRFDLVFIDGLHEWHQTYQDVMNSILHAHPHTLILLDDVIPVDEFSSWPDMEAACAARLSTGSVSTAWQGDVYKVLFALRDHHPQLQFRVIADGNNPQAVIWSPSGYSELVEAPRVGSDAYAELNYSTVFGAGSAPPWFECLPEWKVIDTIGEGLC